jgi:murein DD-endopeptidase MepM/ murein hydrolase activator NlpD
LHDATVGLRRRFGRVLADLQRRLAAVPHPRAPRPTLGVLGSRMSRPASPHAALRRVLRLRPRIRPSAEWRRWRPFGGWSAGWSLVGGGIAGAARAIVLTARRLVALDWDVAPVSHTRPDVGPAVGRGPGSSSRRLPAAHRCPPAERRLHRILAFLVGSAGGPDRSRLARRLVDIGLGVVDHDRFLPTVVAGLLVFAVVAARSPFGAAQGVEGSRSEAPRIAVGGTGLGVSWAGSDAGGPNDGRGPTGPGQAVLGFAPWGASGAAGSAGEMAAAAPSSAGSTDNGGAPSPSPSPVDPRVARLDGPAATSSVDDGGVLFKPVVVDPTVPDGRDTLQTYTVRPGDTLTGIARKFGLSMMTLWWANRLNSKDELHVGQTLVIPPVDGLVITVKEGDTLDAIAARTGVDKETIFNFNGLKDETLVVGQTLVIPGAHGAPIPTPKPTPAPAAPRPVSGGSAGGSATVRPPSSYGGGPLSWPLPGGYISQYFHASHPAIDIADDYGSPVRAAAAGTVIFAGWRSNCGGYQIWIAHGSDLYTTYNHLSAILVGTGSHVGRGQLIGRVGASGCATGPHLHFEVWIGPPWDGGYRVNPLRYL